MENAPARVHFRLAYYLIRHVYYIKMAYITDGVFVVLNDGTGEGAISGWCVCCGPLWGVFSLQRTIGQDIAIAFAPQMPTKPRASRSGLNICALFMWIPANWHTVCRSCAFSRAGHMPSLSLSLSLSCGDVFWCTLLGPVYSTHAGQKYHNPPQRNPYCRSQYANSAAVASAAASLHLCVFGKVEHRMLVHMHPIM